jgi:hypothetical protein
MSLAVAARTLRLRSDCPPMSTAIPEEAVA